MEINKDTHVVMFSVKQQVIHVESWVQMIRNNAECAMMGYSVDFMVMGIYPDHDSACDAADDLRRHLGLGGV